MQKDELDVLTLGPKFVPLTVSDLTQLRVDVLSFSRKLLLIAQFHDIEYIDSSLIKPVSNYIPKSTKYPVLKSIINDLEMFSNELDDLSKNTVDDNLSATQREGLKSIQNSKSILYFNSDKGSAPVLLDRAYYKDKILEKLSSHNFIELNRNMDYFVHLKLKVLVKHFKAFLTKNERNAIINFDYSSTNIYGLPKIHKSTLIKQSLLECTEFVLFLPNPSDLTFRIIFGGPNNPTTGLASLLNEILNPYVSKVKSVIRDSVNFINMLPVFKADDLPFIQMWTIDVKDMYPSIENKLGLRALRYWLQKYPGLRPERFSVDFVLAAMHFVLDNNTGYFDGKFYKQANGTATGIKPAPPYANLVMGYLEIELFYKLELNLGQKVAKYFWHQYRRFLDDGQIMWDTRLGDFLEVFNLLNSMHPSIKFTSESSDKELVFLDIRILKTKVGFETVIYTKETDTDSTLNFNSLHPRHTREDTAFNLARRVRTLTDDDRQCQVQMGALMTKLKNSDYPPGLIRTAVSSAMELNPKDLRMTKVSSNKDVELLTFVHTFDPTLPQITSEVKQLISRIFSSKELKPIFGGIELIDSLREPLNLTRILQHSKFDENPEEVNGSGVVKCGLQGCRSCEEILQVDELYFPNSDVTFKIKAKMQCISRNVIYAIFCQNCGQSYIGETVNFRERMNGHRNKSTTSAYIGAEVSRHLHNCGGGFRSCPIFKVRDETKISRLVMEDIFIKMLKPDLNTDKRNLLHLQ